MECDDTPDCPVIPPPSALTAALIGWIVFLTGAVVTAILILRTKVCPYSLEWRRAFIYVWMIHVALMLYYLLYWYDELFFIRSSDGLIYNHYRSLFLAVLVVLIGIPVSTYFDMGWHDGLAVAFLGAASHVISWMAEHMTNAAGRWIIFGVSVFVWLVAYWIFFLRLGRRPGPRGPWWVLTFWILITDVLYHVNWALYLGAFLYSLTTWTYVGLIIDVITYIAMAYYMMFTHGNNDKYMPMNGKELQRGS